jgi:hypothetical protein
LKFPIARNIERQFQEKRLPHIVILEQRAELIPTNYVAGVFRSTQDGEATRKPIFSLP